jgi:solute carrier family 25 carnitine/acylcarnitine transporter 20/29
MLFASYGACRRAIQPDPAAQLTYLETFLCGSSWPVRQASLPLTRGFIYISGSAAGVGTVALSAPSELLKVRMQIEGQVDPTRRLTLRCATRDLYRARGLAGFGLGLGTTAVRDVPSFGMYFVVYELAVRPFAFPAGHHDMSYDEMGVRGVAGGLAGVVAWGLVYPVDVVKSRLQAQPLAPGTAPLGLSAVTRALIAEQGAAGLFRGLSATLLRAFPLNAVTFLGYEWALRKFHQYGVV